VPLRPPVDLSVEHVELDVASRLEMREDDAASVSYVEYRLEPASTGTRFAQVSDFGWKKLPRILHKAIERGVQRDIQRQLRALKKALETTCAHSRRTSRSTTRVQSGFAA
jgi:hypothetical protein